MRIFPPHAADFYKTGHLRQYPEGTKCVYSNFTPRGFHHAEVLPDFDGKVVNFGLQGTIQSLLIEWWNEEFFQRPRDEVVRKFKRRMDSSLGVGAVDSTHIGELHDLGYLPLEIRALPEGVRVPVRVPLFTVVNTHSKFFWLTNYIETQLSAESWKSITNATIAYEYRRLLEKYAELTGSPKDFVNWQGHDFSLRGMSGLHDGVKSGAAHLVSFLGTDTIAAIDYLEDYYQASDTFVGGSVPASEHSVMCMGMPSNTAEEELAVFKRMITELYPSGVVSIVSDTRDFWEIITDFAMKLKPDIMTRKPDANGLAKTVFRPDSGDPVLILCGDPKAETGSPAFKGAVECLWEIYGGTMTDRGFKLLDSHVGLIYGDSITLKRAQAILENLATKGFASGNVVFGIGSFTYQYVTRDTFGHAYKTTWGQVMIESDKGASYHLESRAVSKKPATDNGLKNSATGLLRVELEDGEYKLYENQTERQSTLGELRVVFANGEAYNQESLAVIRKRLLG